MKFVCYTEWDQLPESADVFLAEKEKDSLFFSRSWFENLSAVALHDDHSMVLACVVADTKVMAILPLMQYAGKTWYSLKHRYTSFYSLLLAKDDQEMVLACLAHGLVQLPVNAFLLEPVADDDNDLNNFQRVMETVGFNCELTFRHYNWIYRVQGQSFEDYMSERPAKLRNTISRKKRKLKREHGYDIRLYTGDEVPQKMSDYYTVYTASWKANEQYTDFLNGMVASFTKQDWPRLAVLYVKERPVAAQLWFVVHGKANIFRLSYDEMWKSYSPGSILTCYLMEYVIDNDKVKEIDFLTGNDTYKQDWMSDRRERFALSCIKSEKPINLLERFIDVVTYLLKYKKVRKK